MRFEVIVNTNVAAAWETLDFDLSTFANFDASHQYNQVVVFPDFGRNGTLPKQKHRW